MEIKEKVEENLVKKTCRELGITQKKLAEMMGLADRTLSKYATEKIPTHIKHHLSLLLKDKNHTVSIQNLKESINNLHYLLNNH